jgi:hypothetical protein
MGVRWAHVLYAREGVTVLKLYVMTHRFQVLSTPPRCVRPDLPWLWVGLARHGKEEWTAHHRAMVAA